MLLFDRSYTLSLYPLLNSPAPTETDARSKYKINAERPMVILRLCLHDD